MVLTDDIIIQDFCETCVYFCACSVFVSTARRMFCYMDFASKHKTLGIEVSSAIVSILSHSFTSLLKPKLQLEFNFVTMALYQIVFRFRFLKLQF